MEAIERGGLQPTSNSSARFVELNTFLTVTILFTFLPLSLRLYFDYLSYLSLGPGGTPATLQGFLKVKALGLFALRNPYEPRRCAAAVRYGPDEGGYLHLESGCLPTRAGERPVVRGIAPQRQITQRSSQTLYDRLASEIEYLAANDKTLRIGTSCFEKHGTGLFLGSSAAIKSGALPNHTTHRCKHEIVHVHASDGSMHLTLHPADSRAVLEAGWGERHPLSRGGRFERFVPVDFMMVYAPRDETEVEMVMRIILAARWFVGGRKVPVERTKDAADVLDGCSEKDWKMKDETCEGGCVDC